MTFTGDEKAAIGVEGGGGSIPNMYLSHTHNTSLVRTHTRTHTHTYAHMHTHTHTHACTHTHTHAHTHNLLVRLQVPVNDSQAVNVLQS